MQNKGLLFIPDISGFTRFVNETEINHSRLIIQELLEILINANQIGLEVSEIEGDAILFYKYGDSPSLPELYKQVEKMFCAFHRGLHSYDLRKFCQCEACVSAIDLTLKVITHYGEFTGYNVKNFSKLIGKDVIVAHQLLKNDIDQHEYWLVTNNLASDATPIGMTQWMRWNRSVKQTENGEIQFHYTHLSQLKAGLTPEPELQLELSQKSKMLSLSREYDTDIITLFHAAGDFRHRHKWRDGVKAVEELGHFLPRLGVRCRCEMENGSTVIYSSSYSYSEEKILFSETDKDKKTAVYYTLEKLAPGKTRLTIDYYIKKNFIAELLFNLFQKKKLLASWQRSLSNLNGLIKQIELPEQRTY